MIERSLNDNRQVNTSNRVAAFLAHNWIWIFVVLFGLYVWIPFLAPVFMAAGFPLPGAIIQTVYSTQCHQMPDRSFFLFGPRLTYSLPEIQAAWQNTMDMTVLRQFVGNPEMGWKVAWSDRMVSMYTSTWVFGLLWWMFSRKVRPLPLWGLILFWLPMAVDGGSHFISDLLGGMDSGFRYDNAWLAALTGQALPTWFYSGNALGSFNSDMRLLTGLLFGIGLVWFAFPILDQSFRSAAQPRPPVILPLQPYQSHYPSPSLPQKSSPQNPTSSPNQPSKET
ncbi:MAG: DUF2085 domain-containing protein [Chloroflexi bacterium]|nr:MAG: DUF2085 domain-containing protein [Chloroflexota bacterium]